MSGPNLYWNLCYLQLTGLFQVGLKRLETKVNKKSCKTTVNNGVEVILERLGRNGPHSQSSYVAFVDPPRSAATTQPTINPSQSTRMNTAAKKKAAPTSVAIARYQHISSMEDQRNI